MSEEGYTPMRRIIFVDTDQAVLLAMAAVGTAFVAFGFPGTALIAGLERVSGMAGQRGRGVTC